MLRDNSKKIKTKLHTILTRSALQAETLAISGVERIL